MDFNLTKWILLFQSTIKLCTDKILPLISAICDRIGLVEMIDEHVGERQNERIISTGNAVKAIAMNIVAGREPAYRIDEFYKYTDTEKMFGTGIKAEHITDDTIARGLWYQGSGEPLHLPAGQSSKLLKTYR